MVDSVLGDARNPIEPEEGGQENTGANPTHLVQSNLLRYLVPLNEVPEEEGGEEKVVPEGGGDAMNPIHLDD